MPPRNGYIDGFKAGRADAALGCRSEVAWMGLYTSPPGTYEHDYSTGYRAGFLGRGLDGDFFVAP